jgi:hypothetical protein
LVQRVFDKSQDLRDEGSNFNDVRGELTDGELTRTILKPRADLGLQRGR